MEKLAELKIGGREIPMHYSTYETIAIQREIGCTAFQIKDQVFGVEKIDEDGLLSGLALSGKDSMQVTVAGNEDRILLVAAYDNLGKGASGAAIECMNMAIGADRKTGLIL